jgi:hypothetical protein
VSTLDGPLNERTSIVQSKAELVLSNLRLCNSGAEIHAVGNMRNQAGLLIESCVTCGSLKELEMLEGICKRLEIACLEFFVKKYSYLKRKKD